MTQTLHALSLTDTVITPPVLPPLTLTYVKSHIRALGNADDTLTVVYINAAASYFEEQTGRQLITATREVWLDAFPFVGASGMQARIELPHPPLQSVISVQYIDETGTLQSFDDGASPATNLFRSSAPSGAYASRGFVEPIAGYTWPIARRETGAVRIRYTCGYGLTPATVPELARGILCYLVGHFDTFRGAVYESRKGQLQELPFGVQMMMDGFKYSALPSRVLHEHMQAFGGGFEWGGWRGGLW
jgi:uncharacterized phiE125 gp8 family phage protein